MKKSKDDWRKLYECYLQSYVHKVLIESKKDYVYGRCYYRSTWKNKEYLRSKDKAKNDMM